ncbi:MAG: dihydropteroate synthase [Symbiobacteriia bacterium]
MPVTTLRLGDHRWPLGAKTYVMGILNVTPDSFSDGGRYLDQEQAFAHAREMLAQGADIIDVGGESTRPGFQSVSAAAESERVVPVVERLVRELGALVSIDTSKAEVARECLAAGAAMVNDVRGLRGDAAIARLCSQYGAALVVMHDLPLATGPDLMDQVLQGLRESVTVAFAAGLTPDQVVIDPGVGFGKDAQGNLLILRELRRLLELGLPTLLGTSRKSTIGKVLGLPVDQRVEGTAATVALATAAAIDIVRVHDVREMARVARMADAVIRGWEG